MRLSFIQKEKKDGMSFGVRQPDHRPKGAQLCHGCATGHTHQRGSSQTPRIPTHLLECLGGRKVYARNGRRQQESVMYYAQKIRNKLGFDDLQSFICGKFNTKTTIWGSFNEVKFDYHTASPCRMREKHVDSNLQKRKQNHHNKDHHKQTCKK